MSCINVTSVQVIHVLLTHYCTPLRTHSPPLRHDPRASELRANFRTAQGRSCLWCLSLLHSHSAVALPVTLTPFGIVIVRC